MLERFLVVARVDNDKQLLYSDEFVLERFLLVARADIDRLLLY